MRAYSILVVRVAARSNADFFGRVLKYCRLTRPAERATNVIVFIIGMGWEAAVI